MQVAEIKETNNVRSKYAEYLQAVRDNPEAKDYRVLKDAYRELSRGRKVIDLAQSLAQGGLDEQRRPRLAVARANAKVCYFFYRDRQNAAERAMFSPLDSWPTGRRRIGLHFRPSLFGLTYAQRREVHCRAIVPTIPPSIRPSAKQLADYFILWEAVWEDLPPTDPMLLRPISKNLYVVVAQWDLTPLERAVLAESVVE